MEVIQNQNHTFVRNTDHLQNLCEKSGFFPGLLQLYLLHDQPKSAIDVVIYTDDEVGLKHVVNYISFLSLHLFLLFILFIFIIYSLSVIFLKYLFILIVFTLLTLSCGVLQWKGCSRFVTNSATRFLVWKASSLSKKTIL